MKYAAIDIGSNAVRLLIADINSNAGETGFKKTILLRVPVRLGDDAFLDKKISERKINDLTKTIIAFKHLLDVYKVEEYMACATSALREAENGQEIVKSIKKQTGISIEIIEGTREANIIYSTHIEQTLDIKLSYLYIDVGGGSTEVSVFSKNKMIASNSFNIGTIRMLDNKDLDADWDALKLFVKENTKNLKPVIGIGTGGNINKLFRLSEEKEGTPLSFEKIKKLYFYLNSYSLKDRIQILGLNQDRADVIIPATEIYMAIMKWGYIKELIVPKVGMVDGIIYYLIEKNKVKI